MTTLSPENSLSAKQSATFILVCSAICFEIGVHCATPQAWPWLVILSLLGAGLTYLTDTCSSVSNASLPNLWFALGLFVPAQWEGWT